MQFVVQGYGTRLVSRLFSRQQVDSDPSTTAAAHCVHLIRPRAKEV